MNGRMKIRITMNKAMFALLLLSACGSSGSLDIPLIFPEDEEPEQQGTVEAPHQVQCRKDKNSSWDTYSAVTVDRIEGFTVKDDPDTDTYGGWTIMNLGNADGYFRVQQAAGRWWLVDPLGNIFLSKAVAVFSYGSSERQQANLKEKYGTASNWAKSEIQFLKEQGFNSVGAWSSTSVIKGLSDDQKIPYAVMVSPTSSFNSAMKSSGKETDAYNAAGWEGYPYDFVCVWDDDFDTYLENGISAIAQYKDDPYCIGYFIDNELPWKQYAIDRCLQKWPASHINHQKAQEWLDGRKGRTGCTINDVTDSDREAFVAYCFDIYMQKVTSIAKKYDPNHLYLGCRFNQWKYELVNPEMWKVAGKYMDIISVNHYQKWQPDLDIISDWASWSGRPFFVTEFYTKGEDSGMGNTTGAGWNVLTQTDRGYFYQNFVNELLKSGTCVGWHWFTYMDNDPTNTDADSSNIDSNKGIVTWDFQRYTDLIDQMRQINECTYNLARFYDVQ